MQTTEKNTSQIINEGRKRIKGSVSLCLGPKLEQFKKVFAERMDLRVVAPLMPEANALRNVPSGSQMPAHGTVSRIDSNLVMIKRIESLIIYNYNEEVDKAVDRLALAADSRSWEPELVEKALAAMEEDIQKHNREISARLDDAVWNITDLIDVNFLNNYKVVIAEAAMLENDIRLIVNPDLEGHLFEIARNVQLKALERV